MNHQFTEEEEKMLDTHFPEYFEGAYYEKEDVNLGDELKEWIRAHDQRLLAHIREEVNGLKRWTRDMDSTMHNRTLDEVLALLT